ncbi:MAG: amino acid racemase [Deltaproteobacteria bacterium]|nr:amino acid racemase [Deltaproteobacteria bacterium]MBW1993175.1 amino acid racemase [Deltaproteobacteria bacterium]
MRKEKVIGVLGGMGPEATLTLFKNIIRNTPASTDQEHIRIIIDNNPKIPDRTAAIIGDGEDPVPMLTQSACTLENAGADFIVIPCISAHYFLEALRRELKIPILSVFDEVAGRVKNEHPEIKTLGLMATSGTIQGGLFQKRLEKEDIRTLVPGQHDQQQVMSAIYQIKSSVGKHRNECREKLLRVANGLIEKGAQGIIAGCTEIPLELTQQDITVPLFDPLMILAQTAIAEVRR